MKKQLNLEVNEVLRQKEFDYLKALEVYYKNATGNVKPFTKEATPGNISKLKVLLEDMRFSEVVKQDDKKPAVLTLETLDYYSLKVLGTRHIPDLPNTPKKPFLIEELGKLGIQPEVIKAD